MKYPILILSLLFSSLTYGEIKLNKNEVFDSANWPPKVAVLEEFEVKETGKIIKAGREGVLIRMEDEKSPEAVIDFGRNGIINVPVDRTDLHERIKKIASDEVEKDIPNWTMMIGRGFVERNNEGVMAKAPLEKLGEYRRMLILYVDDITGAGDLIEPFAELSYNLLEETDTLIVVFVMGLIPYDEFVPAVRASSPNLNIYYMVPHLSAPYAISMHHQLTEFPAAVLVDVEGKTLYKPAEEESFDDSLNSIVKVLKKIEMDESLKDVESLTLKNVDQ